MMIPACPEDALHMARPLPGIPVLHSSHPGHTANQRVPAVPGTATVTWQAREEIPRHQGNQLQTASLVDEHRQLPAEMHPARSAAAGGNPGHRTLDDRADTSRRTGIRQASAEAPHNRVTWSKRSGLCNLRQPQDVCLPAPATGPGQQTDKLPRRHSGGGRNGLAAVFTIVRQGTLINGSVTLHHVSACWLD